MAVRKRKGWWYAVYPNGRNKSGKIKYTEKKISKYKKEAEKVANSLYNRFKMVEAGLTPETEQKRLQGILDWFLTHPKIKSNKSITDIKRYAENIVDEFGHLLLTEITPTMIENWHDKIKENVSIYTANRHLSTLKRWMNLAIREGWITKNPCFKVEMFNERPRNRVISYKQFLKLVSTMPEHASDICQVAYWTGMRRSEILGLKWSTVNLVNCTIYLGETKNGEPRMVYFNHLVLEIFRRRRFRHSEYVFTYNGNPIGSIKTAFRKACKRAGIEDFRFHDLRHCFRTNCRRAGIDRAVSKDMMGHKSDYAHSIYDTVEEVDIRAAYRQLENKILEESWIPERRQA